MDVDPAVAAERARQPATDMRYVLAAIVVVAIALFAIVTLLPGGGEGWVAQVVVLDDDTVCVEARNGGGPADAKEPCLRRSDGVVGVPWRDLRRGACVTMEEGTDGQIELTDLLDAGYDCSPPTP